MLPPEKLQWLKAAYSSALSANVLASTTLGTSYVMPPWWAKCAACEAAEETGWGIHTPPNSNNVLGIKAFKGYKGKIVFADGTEQLTNGAMTKEELDGWRCYDSMTSCFLDQITILHRQLSPNGLLRYAPALAAQSPQDYIRLECQLWSTSLQKGQQVQLIFNAHAALLV